MSGHGLGWFAVDWRQMWEKKQQRTGGVIWVSLTWGETSQSKQRGPLSEASRDPRPSHVSSLWRLPTAKKREYWVLYRGRVGQGWDYI